MWFAARMLDLHPHTVTRMVAVALALGLLIGLAVALFGLWLM
jgi:hypothetical protein